MTLLAPTIAVTMGDPAGVGPELCLRLLGEPRVLEHARIVVVGSLHLLRRVVNQLGWEFPAGARTIADWSELPSGASSLADRALVLDLPTPGIESVRPAHPGADTGRAAFAYVNAAIDAALAGTIDAVTTGPLGKAALHEAGIDFPGHTEIFAKRCHARRWCMMQYSDAITCSFVTTHVGYLDAVRGITPQRVLDVIELTDEALRALRGRTPRIVVCGLNPHAGEAGLFGDGEEQRLIEPAVADARRQGMEVTGPVPADTAFVPDQRARTDAYVCMYHDQGHIPVKALAFDSAVNTTIGLPIVRTSVDHGTALDIAWRGVANPGSMLSAVALAGRLALQRIAGQRASAAP